MIRCVARKAPAWIDRSLFVGPRVAAVASQRQFKRVLASIGVSGDDDAYCDPCWGACVHTYECNGELVCVVGLNMALLGAMDGVEAAGVMTHEAVHIWQRVRDRLGPGDLGREMEAYAVQNIATGLMRALISFSPGLALGT